MQISVENAAERETEATGELELQVDARSLDAKELLESLSKKSFQRFVVLYHKTLCTYCQPGNDQASSSQSACLPLALNTAHIMFNLERRPDLQEMAGGAVAVMFSEETLDECMHLDESWTKGSPSFETLIDLPPFRDSFSRVLLFYDECSHQGFMNYFKEMWDNAPHLPIVAGVITYIGETVLCLRLQLNFGFFSYAILDPHRRSVPDRGPAFVLFTSRDGASTFLHDIWKDAPKPTISSAEDGLQIQHFNFTGHIILRGNPAPHLPSSPTQEEGAPLPILESSSLSPSLALNETANSDLSAPQNSRATSSPTSNELNPSQKSPNTRKKDVQSPPSLKDRGAKARLQREFGWQLGLQSQQPTLVQAERSDDARSKAGDELVARTPESKLEKLELDVTGKNAKSSRSSVSSNGAEKDVKLPASRLSSPSRDQLRSPAAPSLSSPKRERDLAKKDIGWQLALQQNASEIKLATKAEASPTRPEVAQVQNEPQASSSNLKPKSAKLSSPRPQASLQTPRSENKRQPARDDFGWQAALAAKSMTFPAPNPSNYADESQTGPQTPPSSSSEWGVLPQKSPSVPSFQDTSRKAFVLKKVECELCVTKVSVINGHRLQDCDHCLCRGCARSHILAKLEESSFPIQCPVCVAASRIVPGRVDQQLVKAVGLTHTEVERFQHLEFVNQSVDVACPKCGYIVSKDRQEILDRRILMCAWVTCNYRWCKVCRRQVKDGDKHVCKDSKLDQLIKRKGFRYCPSCQTPAQKHHGLNHITCATPGCLMHFCYRCGDAIVKGRPEELDVSNAVISHYETCLEMDGKCSIQ